MTNRSKQLFFIIITAFALGYILILWGFFPFNTFGTLNHATWSVGFGESLAKGGLFSYPTHMGYPLGAPIVFGLPFNTVQALLIKLTRISAVDAYSLAAVFFLLVAFTGCYYLAKRLNASPLVAILSSTLYLSTSFVYNHEAFGPLGFAFALFPTYFLLTWFVLERVSLHLNALSTIWAAIAISFIATFALFMDGYSFIMYALSASAIALYYSCKLKNKGLKFLLIPPGLLLLGLAIAAFSYKAYVQTDLYIPSSEDVFRAMSPDLITLLTPTRGGQSLYDWLGLSVHRDINAFYGDNTAFSWNFIGILFIVALPGWFTIQLHRLLKWGLVSVALIALLLAIGPSVKFKSYRTDINDENRITANYKMPQAAALADMPYHRLYTQLAGIKYMRATYRWLLLFKFIIWLFAIASLIYLYQRKPFLCIILMSCLLIESAPALAISKRISQSKQNYNMLQQLQSDIVSPLAEYLNPGEIAYFWPDKNDFTINFIAPTLGIHAYNVGGDKNGMIARQSWPSLLKNHAIKELNSFPKVTQLLFALNLADVVVVPFFDMVEAVHLWPLNPNETKQRQQQFASIKEKFGESIRINEDKYFAILRPDPNFTGSIKIGISVGQTFTFNNQGSNLYVLESGWSPSESWGTWSDAATASIMLPLTEPLNSTPAVIADVLAYTLPEYPQQFVDVYVNGKYVDHWIFNHAKGSSPRKIPVPIEQETQLSVLKIEFVIKQPISPAELGRSNDQRKLGIGIKSIRLVDK